jgi:hypothetical protein
MNYVPNVSRLAVAFVAVLAASHVSLLSSRFRNSTVPWMCVQYAWVASVLVGFSWIAILLKAGVLSATPSSAVTRTEQLMLSVVPWCLVCIFALKLCAITVGHLRLHNRTSQVDLPALQRARGRHEQMSTPRATLNVPSGDTLTRKEKIEILFKEYDTLRTEIMTRTNNGYQLSAIAAGAMTWLISRPIDIRFWIASTLAAVVFSLFYVLIMRDINKFAARIRELEGEINALSGADLLEWETHWGGAAAGHLGPAHPKTRQKSH